MYAIWLYVLKCVSQLFQGHVNHLIMMIYMVKH